MARAISDIENDISRCNKLVNEFTNLAKFFENIYNDDICKIKGKAEELFNGFVDNYTGSDAEVYKVVKNIDNNLYDAQDHMKKLLDNVTETISYYKKKVISLNDELTIARREANPNDANGDGQVNIADAVTKARDANGDGQINIADMVTNARRAQQRAEVPGGGGTR